MKKLYNLLKKLSSLNLFFWSIIWLMVITVLGTIDQKNIGLFAAQEKYFSSFYFTFYKIPLPGGGTIILLMSLSLISQLVFKTNFKNKSRMGITLAHFGALILLLGSFITHKFAQEGSLVFKEGEAVNYIQDYKKFDLVVLNSTSNKEFFRLDLDKSTSTLPYKINEELILNNIKIIKGCQLVPNSGPKDSEVGFAKMFVFELATNSAGNELCAELEIKKQDSLFVYRVFNQMAKDQSIQIGNENATIQIQNQKISLPFKMQLLDFDKKFHQGTMISKSFKSHVLVQDGDLTFKRIIEMNSPLRYKGYTFYQSSFSENSDGEISELAVVKNQAQWFPYVSSLILCFGVLLHLVIRSREKKPNQDNSAGTQV